MRSKALDSSYILGLRSLFGINDSGELGNKDGLDESEDPDKPDPMTLTNPLLQATLE